MKFKTFKKNLNNIDMKENPKCSILTLHMNNYSPHKWKAVHTIDHTLQFYVLSQGHSEDSIRFFLILSILVCKGNFPKYPWLLGDLKRLFLDWKILLELEVMNCDHVYPLLQEWFNMIIPQR